MKSEISFLTICNDPLGMHAPWHGRLTEATSASMAKRISAMSVRYVYSTLLAGPEMMTMHFISGGRPCMAGCRCQRGVVRVLVQLLELWKIRHSRRKLSVYRQQG